MLFHIVSLLREALFPRNYRPCDFSMYVCLASSSVIVKEIWWRHQAHTLNDGEHGHAIAPFCLPHECQRPDVTRRGGWIPLRLSPRLSVSPDMLQEATITGVQRTRRIANLPGHLARLTLFKQVPRRLVSCLVKWLTFWFNQHPRLPDELDHYQKCTGSAVSLTCQSQTHLLIYLLHSHERSIVTLCGLKVVCPWCFVKLGWAPGTSIILSPTHIILKTHNGGLEKKNKHGIPSVSLLNMGYNLLSVEDDSTTMF